jgi:hypothetical protein
MNKKDFIIRTCSCLVHYPFVSKTDAMIHSKKSTAQLVWESLPSIPIKANEIFKHAEEYSDISKWIDTLKSSNNKFELQLYTTFQQNEVTEPAIHMLAASVIAYREYAKLNKSLKLLKSNLECSEWIGKVGDSIKTTGQVLSVDRFKQFNKNSWAVRLADMKRRLVIYYNATDPNLKYGEMVDISGKISHHGIMNEIDMKYTRVKT